MGDKPQTAEARRGSKKPSKAAIDAGCEILYERIAEAFEREYRDLLSRIYIAMRRCNGD